MYDILSFIFTYFCKANSTEIILKIIKKVLVDHKKIRLKMNLQNYA